MRILHLSDTHGLHRRLRDLPAADVLVHSGDFTMAGSRDETRDFVRWLEGLPYAHKLFIAGNHDGGLYGVHPGSLPGGIHYLCHSGIEIKGVGFYGVPLFVEDDLRGLCASLVGQIPDGVDVLVTHQPPYGILDYAGGVHWGSCPLAERVREVAPRYHLFGHVHDAAGVNRLGATVYANAAVVDEEYSLRNGVRLFDLSL